MEERFLSVHRIGIAQINPIVGNLEYNANKIIENLKKAESQHLDMVVFPEFALMGYPFGNIIDRHPFIAEENLKWIKFIAERVNNTVSLVGFAEPAEKDSKYKFYNSVAILKNGKIERIIRESNKAEILNLNGVNYGIITGESYFQSENVENRADVYINISSIKVCPKESYIKNNLFKNHAQKFAKPFVYVNRAGAVDSFVFEGNSRAIGKDGKVFASAKYFEEDFITLDPMSEEGEIKEENNLNEFQAEQKEFTLDYEPDLERTYKTIITGIKDYFSKCGLKRAVLGLSGGLDSTVCAVLLSDALGKENVLGISMPSKITTEGSKSDAKTLAENLGINFVEKSIKELTDSTKNCFGVLFDSVEKKWDCRYKESYTIDNIQARLRAMYLWGISNEFASCIPIATSDKSEAYMGYATINGDMSGGFAPIADITKTKLFALARWLNKNREQKDVIPESIILKKPGAELAINPKTGKPLEAEEALMPYEFLDEIIWRIENKNESYKDLMNSEFLYEKKEKISKEQKKEWVEKFYRRMSSALYKWTIMPPSVIVESNTINGNIYSQPITSGKINYKTEN